MKYELHLTDKQTILLEFVRRMHGDQKRKYTGVPYWTHPLEVATIASEYAKDDFVVEIALCHDLFEDTECTSEQLYEVLMRIGYYNTDALFICNRVDDLTDYYTTERFPKIRREVRKIKEATRLATIPSISQSVKYADLIDNTSSIVEHDPEFAVVYLKEKYLILDLMRAGDVNLYAKCCYTYFSSLKKLLADVAAIADAAIKESQKLRGQ